MTTPGTAQRLLHHREDGPDSGPPLILGPSLGTSLAVWDPQVPGLARTHRVIRWDLPGHGGSPAGLLTGTEGTEGGAATVGDVARLVLELADALGIDRFAYAGISFGGAVGTWLAVHHPARVESLALVCSAARFGGPEGWRERAALVRAKGTGPVADTAATRWFTPHFADEQAAGALVADLRAADPEAYAACCDALAAFDLRRELPRVTAPTLVVAGRLAPAVPLGHARDIADTVPDASLTEVAQAAHLASVERRLPSWPPSWATSPAPDRPLPRTAPATPPGRLCAVPSSATRTSTGPSPGPPRSRPSSRTSSPATHGAKSGPGPA